MGIDLRSFPLAICFFLISATLGADEVSDLMQDLFVVDCINRKLKQEFPVYYNSFLQGGYINMPSARVAREGDVGFGYTSVPPYRIYSARVQYFDFLEATLNYRIFSGILDPVLGELGFGEFSDKGANLKLTLLHPEDSDFVLPGIALGIDDFLGTRAFKGYYGVVTQVIPAWDMELSLGYGFNRIHGFFGGMAWTPWRWYDFSPLRGLAFFAEYDHTDYRHDPHPKGKVQNTHWNIGLKWRLWNYLDLSCSWVRGQACAFSISGSYNLGETCGFLPKIDDPLPYRAPANHEPISYIRPEKSLAEEFTFVLQDHGFELLEAWLSYDLCMRKIFRITVYNCRWRTLGAVKQRLGSIIAELIPEDVDEVIVVMEGYGLPVQELRFQAPFLESYADQCMGNCELSLLTDLREVGSVDPCRSQILLKRNRQLFCYHPRPDLHTFFGSSKGKFRYAFGLAADISGFLWGNWIYDMTVGCIFFSSLGDLTGVDRLNPSQLINVHTDIIRYYKKHRIQFPKLYIQRAWNLGRGWYTRIGGGNFEYAYGGAVWEFLYYPVKAPWAIGIEGAILRKRTLTGLGYSDKIRKLHGFVPSFQKFHGSQYFLDLYYDWRFANTDFKVSVGKFMANDHGARVEIGRYFPSGLRFYFWYTRTNGHDIVNGQVYYDKGIGFTMPIDIFYTCSSRETWGHSMSAWLRDVGYRSCTGRRLYETIHRERLRY